MQTINKEREALGHGADAFTLIELAVITAMLALLALCVLPILARTHPDTRAAQCLNNHRQLSRAWRIYADDNNDRLPGSIHSTGISANNPNAPWVQGSLNWTTSFDNTNTVSLTDPRYASIANYCGRDSRLFKCPADNFLSSVQRNVGWKERVRSIASSVYLGGVDVNSGPIDPDYVVVKKWTELNNPRPAGTWLLMDEHPDSINDPSLFSPRASQWVDLPANLHDGGAGVAYADGSAEVRRWQGSLLKFDVGFSFPVTSAPADDPDIAWVRAHTPRKAGAN